MLKAATKYRIHSHPEKVMANHWLLQQAIDMMPAVAQQPLYTIEQLQQMGRADASNSATAATQAHALDSEPLSSSSVPLGHLQGAGKVLATCDRLWSDICDGVLEAIVSNSEEEAEQQQWTDVAEEGWRGCKVYQHTSAVMPSGHQVTSTSYSRSRTRGGSSALVHLEHNGTDKPFIITVNYFLRILHPQLPTQRVAMSSIHAYKAPLTDRDLGEMVYDFDSAEYSWTEFPVLLPLIEMPCIKAHRKVHGAKRVTYVPFSFMSGM